MGPGGHPYPCSVCRVQPCTCSAAQLGVELTCLSYLQGWPAMVSPGPTNSRCKQLLRRLQWAYKPYAYFDTTARAVSWLVAGGAFFGGTLFIIGSFCGIAPKVSLLYACVLPDSGCLIVLCFMCCHVSSTAILTATYGVKSTIAAILLCFWLVSVCQTPHIECRSTTHLCPRLG